MSSGLTSDPGAGHAHDHEREHGRGPDREQPFTAPWQAQVFAMTVTLHERGLFTWPEWARVLGRHLEAGADDGSDYYERWADALQEIVTERGIATTDDVLATTRAWHAAAARTPHGQPIELDLRT